MGGEKTVIAQLILMTIIFSHHGRNYLINLQQWLYID